MTRRVHRHRVVVGGAPYQVELTGDPLHVEAVRIGAGPRASHAVDFWVEYADGAPTVVRTFEVFGTGHELPDGARHVGSTARTEDGFVWHLYELREGGA